MSTWLGSFPSCGRRVSAAREEALQPHNAEQQVIQAKRLDALADRPGIRPQEIRRHCFQCLKDFPVLLHACSTMLRVVEPAAAIHNSPE